MGINLLINKLRLFVESSQLEMVCNALKVLRTVRVKKACTQCDCINEEASAAMVCATATS
jgi:transposase